MNEHEELREDIDRVVELACKTLSPKDADLLRWYCGTTGDDRSEAWRQIEMNCTCGEE